MVVGDDRSSISTTQDDIALTVSALETLYHSVLEMIRQARLYPGFEGVIRQLEAARDEILRQKAYHMSINDEPDSASS